MTTLPLTNSLKRSSEGTTLAWCALSIEAQGHSTDAKAGYRAMDRFEINQPVNPAEAAANQ